MASPASLEASEIRRRGRQRLIGAIALVLLLVVFVPMLLDSEPRPPRHEPSVVIPPKDGAPPLPPPSRPAAAPAEAPAEAPKAPAEAPRAPAVAQPATTPKVEGFAVQVGAFRDEDKLKQSRDRLTAAGVAHYTERVETASGPITRLRAGPFPTREAAEGTLAKLKRSSIDGKVIPLQ